MSTCIKCDFDIPCEMSFDTMGDIVDCPNCNTRYEIDYEETYDPGTNEEDGWFALTEVKDD